MLQNQDKEAAFISGVNKTIAPYRIQHCLGGGGVGDVYVAESLTMSPTKVAIKALKEDIKDQLLIQRFRLEFDLLRRMEHPSIAKVFDYHVAGRPFFTMEYLEGEDLKSAYDVRQFGINEGRLFEWLIPICFQILDALRYLHQHKIIHRDLKPQNIMVLADGAVKILDFGIARDQDSRMKLTQHHEILGTFEYIAPEILMGKAYDHRIDLYSIGAFLYQFVSRKRMFEVHTLVDMFREKTTNESPELSPGKWPGYEWFITFINRLNRRVPDQRFISAGEALTWLKEFRSESDLVADVTLSSVASPMLTIRSAPLVEREDLLNEVGEYLDRMEIEPFFISGCSGSGKSRVCQMIEMESLHRQVNAIVIDGARFAADNKPFVEFVWDQVQFQFGREGEMITDAPSDFGITQFAESLHELLRRERLVIVIDDMHLLPKTGMMQILNYFLHEQSKERSILVQWFFVYNSEWLENLEIRGGSSLIDLMPSSREWELKPLGQEGVMQLAAYLLENRPVTAELTRELVAHTGGIPYALANLLDLLLEKELLHFRSGEWILVEEQKTASLDAFIQLANKAFEDRYLDLDPVAQQVLKWMTVAGMRVSRELLVKLMPVHPDALDHALNELFLDQSIEIQDNQLTLHDPALARFIHENLEPFEVEEFNRTLLQVLEEESGDDQAPFFLKLLRHATLANDKAKIFYYSRKLGAFFFGNGMYEEAQQYLANAISNYVGEPRTALFEAYFAKGEAELCLYRLVEAFADFKSAHDLLDLIKFPNVNDADAHRDMFRRLVLHKMFLIDLRRKRVADAYGHLESVQNIHKRLAGKYFEDSCLDFELRISVPQWEGITYPSRAPDQITQNLFKMCFDTLVEQDQRGVYVGRLAKNWTWHAAEHKLVFDLHQGRNYSNGAILRPEDILFSLKMIKEQPAFNPVLTNSAKRILESSINPHKQLEVIYQKGHGPNFAFWADLPILPSYVYMHQVSEFQLTEDKLFLGSGLYQYVKNEQGTRTFKRTDPKTKVIPNIQLVPKPERIHQAFKADAVHFSFLTQKEWLELTPKGQIQSGVVRDFVVSNQVYRLCFKLGSFTPFSAPVRKALYESLQLESWNSLYLNNQFVVAREQLLHTQSTVGTFKVVKRAEDKLVEALQNEGWVRQQNEGWVRKDQAFTINLLVLDNCPIRVVLEAMAKRWREMGFVVKIAYKPLELFDQYVNHQKVNAWVDSVFVDPDYEGIGDFLHSADISVGANQMEYRSPEMDQAILGLEHVHIVQRKSPMLKINQIFARDLPWLPLFQPKIYYGYNVQLGGVSMTPKGLFSSQRQIQDLHKI